MSYELWFHPLSSYCWKALIALYETDTTFEPKLVDFGDPDSIAAFKALWPMAKMPVLTDGGHAVPESSIIIDYLGGLVPADPEQARWTRLKDRFYDLYIHTPMQKIVGDRLRPEGAKDPFGVDEARRLMRTAYQLADQDLGRGGPWAMGDDFTLADCAAFPALHYGDRVEPFGADLPNLTAYLQRLTERPAVARVLKEAEPYAHMFPG